MKKKFIYLILFFPLVVDGSTLLCQQKTKAWDGSRTTPVHLIQLRDEFDQLIVPTLPYPLPYSTRFTCAPCHDYELINQGLHFNASSSPEDGRPGEPWVWVEPKTGTILPLSYHNWPGVWNPEDVGLSPWNFTLLFGRHMAGGGVGEPSEEVSPESRWNVSGKLEINCMACHNASRIQSHSEWAKQVLRQNFRWAATAASGLGEVGGMASRLPDTWDIIDGPNPDDTEWAVVPYVRYKTWHFDSQHRVFFDISGEPDDSRCLTCHSVSRAGSKKFTAVEDVHSAAGKECVDCHRNDISHNMIRGYEAEYAGYGREDAAEFTCQGCHMGRNLARKSRSETGRLGAPYPRHRGIPAVHFERLSCTVCHAGFRPAKSPVRVRTSRANRLGIYGIARWSTEMPYIFEPVYLKDSSGKIHPHRLMWPAFWGLSDGEKITLLPPSDIRQAGGDILYAEEQVVRILTALALYAELEGIPVFVARGKAYEPNVDGRLDVSSLVPQPLRADTWWGVKKEGKISPLIPQFDPKSEESEAGVEEIILSVLDALEKMEEVPGPPALLCRDVLYVIKDGYLEKKPAPRKAKDYPELVWVVKEGTMPLVSNFQVRTVVSTVGTEYTLTEEQVKLILDSLSRQKKSSASYPSSFFFYVSGGRMFRLGPEGDLISLKHRAAGPVVWPLAHHVRPAQQSLGSSGCRDCHSANSSFFFHKVRAVGALKIQNPVKISGHSLMGLSKPYQKLFGLSFRLRPLLKTALFISATVIGTVVFLLFLLSIGKLSGLIEKRR